MIWLILASFMAYFILYVFVAAWISHRYGDKFPSWLHILLSGPVGWVLWLVFYTLDV